MDFIINTIAVIALVFLASFPFIWIWIFYYEIKCRKIKDCTNRKCKFWKHCDHSFKARRIEQLELTIQRLSQHSELQEEQRGEE